MIKRGKKDVRGQGNIALTIVFALKKKLNKH